MNNFSIPSSWLSSPVKIALVGIGGTGSELADELFSMDFIIQKLSGYALDVTLFDSDEVSEFNVGRQRFWPHDVGFNKAEVLASRYNNFGHTDWKFLDRDFIPSDASKFDLIITAVDKGATRNKIGKHWKKLKTDALWLDCGNDKNSGNVILGHLGLNNETHLPNVYDLYSESFETMIDNDSDSCSHEEAIQKQDFGVNRTAARFASNILWQLIRHGSINHHGSFYNLSDGESTPLSIDQNVWLSFGYAA